MRRTCRHRIAIVLVAICVIGAGARPAHGEERLALRAELGAEFDSNVHRAEKLNAVTMSASSPPATEGPVEDPSRPDAIIASPLTRMVLSWSAGERLGDRHDVAFSILGAGKLFWDRNAQNENVGVVETTGAWAARLASRYRLGLNASYYEALQAVTPAERALGYGRDFRSIAPTLRLARFVGANGVVSVVAGYRWFTFKPAASHSFGAPVLGLEYQWGSETADGAAEWELGAGAAAELRRFQGTRFVPWPTGCAPSACAPIPDPAGARHQDQFMSGHLQVTRTGAFLLGAAYIVQWNRSNSFAEGLIRHVGMLRFALGLPLGIYMAARGELVFARYADPVSLAIGPTGMASVSVEEENRSQVRLELSRNIGERFQIIARGSYYANPFGDRVAPYERLTTTLSLSYAAE